MTQYCYVQNDAVEQGPMPLPKTWADPNTGESYSNFDAMDPVNLLVIGWYLYLENDSGRPGEQYNRTYSPFRIETTYVERDVLWVEWSQEQKDQNADTTITDSQRVAADLALQTETILSTNQFRLDTGAAPIIPADDVANIQTYLGTLYTATDDPSVAPTEPPGATRQITEVPDENRDRLVVERYLDTWNTPDDVNGVDGRLYTSDATDMSLKVHDASGTYLWTQPFEESEPGVWITVRHSSYWFTSGYEELQFVIFKGQDLTQKVGMAADSTEQVYDLRWSNGVLAGRGSPIVPGNRGIPLVRRN